MLFCPNGALSDSPGLAREGLPWDADPRMKSNPNGAVSGVPDGLPPPGDTTPVGLPGELVKRSGGLVKRSGELVKRSGELI